jgi:uncharacterized protein
MTATTKDGRALDLARDDEHERYVGSVDGQLAAVAYFTPSGRLITFTHTETDPSFEGQGVASQLVRWALDDARRRGLRVVPVCPFVKSYVARHEDEYADLVVRTRTSPGDE